MAIASSGWRSPPVTRVFAGMARGRRSGRLKVALVRVQGEGWGARSVHTDGVSLPRRESESPRAILHALVQLAHQADVALSAIDGIGLGDCAPDVVRLGSLLAERTGATVVCRFADRDIVAGGRGDPLSPVPDWFLYRSSTTTRLILDMGTTLRVSVLEKGASLLETLAFDAAPGMDILDELMRRLSGGRIPFDPSGHYAVQGRVCEPLVQQWLSHPFFVRTRPGLIDDATFSDSWFESSLTLASEHRLSAKDVLCSATHFLARSLVEGIRRHLPARLTLEEVIGGGGGLRNGFLVRLLEDRLGGIPLVRSDDVGLPAELTPAIQSAVFAYLALENLPGNLPSATGALSERVLGLLIPGSQGNWDRWVCGVADRFEWETRRAA